MQIPRRNIALCIVLSIVTCGIYGLYWLLCLAEDVLHRWYNDSEGRVLPGEYLWFQGDGKHNWFRNAYKGGDIWDYSATSPYES